MFELQIAVTVFVAVFAVVVVSNFESKCRNGQREQPEGLSNLNGATYQCKALYVYNNNNMRSDEKGSQPKQIPIGT